jgi:hypothetical protein
MTSGAPPRKLRRRALNSVVNCGHIIIGLPCFCGIAAIINFDDKRAGDIAMDQGFGRDVMIDAAG